VQAGTTLTLALPRPLALIEEARERQRRRRGRISLALATLAACAAAGYGVSARPAAVGPATAPEQAAVPDPCALLTNADVAKVLGGEVAYRTAKPEYHACSWSGWPYLHQYGQKAVTIDVAGVSRADFDRAFSTWIVVTREFASRHSAKSTPIRGVGEAAFAQIFAGASLEVYYRGLVISIDTTMLRAPLAAEKRLAAAAIARLDRTPSETSAT
jgi:hypothetical protein